MWKIRIINHIITGDDTFIVSLHRDSISELRGALLSTYILICSNARYSHIAALDERDLALTGYSNAVISQAIEELETMEYIEVIQRPYYARHEISLELRWKVFKRDGYCCVYCGKEIGPFEIDHKRPVSRGGTNEESNLVTCCPACNRHKSDSESWVS